MSLRDGIRGAKAAPATCRTEKRVRSGLVQKCVQLKEAGLLLEALQGRFHISVTHLPSACLT